MHKVAVPKLSRP